MLKFIKNIYKAFFPVEKDVVQMRKERVEDKEIKKESPQTDLDQNK